MPKIRQPSNLTIFPLVAALLVAASQAQAQFTGSESILPEIAVRGQGWAQLRDLGEVKEFALAFIETTVMISVLAYHPNNIATRKIRSDFEAPKSLFIYALIGMVVGFLIMHHGYLIGFVLFGIGGLLRLRTDDGAAGTMRLILATLIGLCVGLDLPVIALITTIGIWLVLFVFGARASFAIEVRFDDKTPISDSMLQLRDLLNADGFRVASISKTKFKPVVHYVVRASRGNSRSGLERRMGELLESSEAAIADWHIEA